MRLTNSQITYLCAILNTSNPTITKLADKLGFSKPSVVNACENIKNMGLINYSKKEISLTELGKKYAINYDYRKKTIEIFLKEVLYIDDKYAIEDARKIMQTVSCQTIEALDKYLIEVLDKKRTDCICSMCIHTEEDKSCNN